MSQGSRPPMERRRRDGLLLAGASALISGVSVFVNGYGVRAWAEISDATTYTTIKNVGASLILLVVATLVRRRSPTRGLQPAQLREHRGGLILVAVIGGSVAFVLFFEGLARAATTEAAFIHKTLLIWVAILAVTFLRESLGLLHVAAIALLVWGQAVLAGGFPGVGWGPGEWMILAATILWSVETVIAKRLLSTVTPLTLGVARLGGGAILLVAFGLWQGAFGSLAGVTPEHLLWVALTALTLSAYVGTWFAALSLAPAVDVTAVLVGGAIITAMLESGIRGAALPSVAGLALVIAGVALIFIPRPRPAQV